MIQIGYCGNASLFFLFSCQERQDLKRVKVVVHLKVIFWGAKEGTCPLSPPWLCPWWKVKHQNISCWEFPNLWYVKIRKKTITLHKKLHGPAVCLHLWSWSNFTILGKFYKMWQCSFFLNATNHILKQKYLYPTQQIHNELKGDNFFFFFFGCLISCSNSGYFILLGTFYSINSRIVKCHCWVAMRANNLLWYEISNNRYKTLQFPKTHMSKPINQQNAVQTQSLL